MAKSPHQLAMSDPCPSPFPPASRTSDPLPVHTQRRPMQACKDNGGYTTPRLNDKLFLNFHGFATIENMEEYEDLKAIFLEGNCLQSLEGLPPLPSLRCLFVQQNVIREISHLDSCPNIDTLNIANNRIRIVSGLDAQTCLNTLNLAHNQISSVEDVQHLLAVTTLSVLDLSHNKIEDEAVIDLLKQMKNLRCLYLQGNPVVSTARHYRKGLIAALPQLNYLDDRPVFELERVCAVAWHEGGLDAERDARKAFRDAEKARDQANFEAMLEIKREAWKIKRERLGLPPGDTDPDMDDISSDEMSSDEEPPELIAARDRLAAYTGRDGEAEPEELTAARRRLAAAGRTIEEVTWQSAVNPELGPSDSTLTQGVENLELEVEPTVPVVGTATPLGDSRPASALPELERVSVAGDTTEGEGDDLDDLD